MEHVITVLDGALCAAAAVWTPILAFRLYKLQKKLHNGNGGGNGGSDGADNLQNALKLQTELLVLATLLLYRVILRG